MRALLLGDFKLVSRNVCHFVIGFHPAVSSFRYSALSDFLYGDVLIDFLASRALSFSIIASSLGPIGYEFPTDFLGLLNLIKRMY